MRGNLNKKPAKMITGEKKKEEVKMKRVLLMMFVAMAISAIIYSVSFAANPKVTVSFPAGGASYVITGVIAKDPYDGTTDDWDALGKKTSLNFTEAGPLEELIADKDDAANFIKAGDKLGTFGPKDKRYYAVDISVSGGGFPSDSFTVNVSYPTAGIEGKKIRAVFKNVVWKEKTAPKDFVQKDISDKLLKDVKETFKKKDFTGQWVRLYLGIITNPKQTGIPTGAEAFTYSDTAGTYGGDLVIAGSG